jgi:glycosyltransferase involved in cell wall biosynthesis
MIRYLEESAPCVYLPNNDYEYSCISPKLSERVGIVGNIHSEFLGHDEQYAAQGKYWNATVFASSFLAKKFDSLYPNRCPHLTVIPYGVSIPAQMPARAASDNGPLRVLYAGRLVQQAKRVFDLPQIVAAVHRRQVPVQLELTGAGWDEEELKRVCQPLVEQGLIRFLGIVSEEALYAAYESSDAYLLTSEYEGKPVGLVEAMGRGCVPVVTDIPSGVPDLVKNEVNGFLVPVGDIEAFADRLAQLYHNVELRRKLSQNAYATVDQGGYRVEDMVRLYADLFRRVMREAESGAYRRPSGRIKVPGFLKPSWKERLPEPLRTLGVQCKRALRRVRTAGGNLLRPSTPSDKEAGAIAAGHRREEGSQEVQS